MAKNTTTPKSLTAADKNMERIAEGDKPLVDRDPETGRVVDPETGEVVDLETGDAGRVPHGTAEEAEYDAADMARFPNARTGEPDHDPETGEIDPPPAPPSQDTRAVAANPASAFEGGGTIRVVKHVSLPVLPFKPGTTITAQIVDAFKEGKKVEGGTISTPARLCTIKSPTGVMRTLIANKVLEKEIQDAYPADSYVGKWFQITRLMPREGKRYATYLIAEVELTPA